jgi:hypothetical protein
MYSVHFPEMFAYYPAKIQKNIQNSKKNRNFAQKYTNIIKFTDGRKKS